ncbi:MAG: protein-L-isoaspartate O-methyltransferase [Alphaproteobacteria bacterium]|nr:protein-L-isoaspartate O-methyltransferase [Alphaproteobacteria bacterium]
MDDGEVIPYQDMCQIMLARIRAHASSAAAKGGRPHLCPRVIDAFGRVPRQDYVPDLIQFFAYMDSPLPIGHQKTISQPFIAAVMTDLLAVEPGHKVLEIGTGLGFHAAVLAELGATVYTVEIIPDLAEEAKRRLTDAGYRDIRFKCGDGNFGWPEAGGFDRILLTAATAMLPPMLLGQLNPRGRMVLPCGIEGDQKLLLVEKSETGDLALEESVTGTFAWLDGDLTAEHAR